KPQSERRSPSQFSAILPSVPPSAGTTYTPEGTLISRQRATTKSICLPSGDQVGGRRLLRNRSSIVPVRHWQSPPHRRYACLCWEPSRRTHPAPIRRKNGILLGAAERR